MSRTIRILYIHTMMFHRGCWQQATDILAETVAEYDFKQEVGAPHRRITRHRHTAPCQRDYFTG